MDNTQIVDAMRAVGVRFDPGLSDSERAEIEAYFGFHFPPDLAALLETALPVSHGFIDWRRGECAPIRDTLDWPFDGLCKDIEENGFWVPEWGEMPEVLGDRFRIAGARLAEAPTLIPICGFRFIPEQPHEVGNPVFSVYQGHVLCYGADLVTYLERELRCAINGRPSKETPKQIPFWSRLAG